MTPFFRMPGIWPQPIPVKRWARLTRESKTTLRLGELNQDDLRSGKVVFKLGNTVVINDEEGIGFERRTENGKQILYYTVEDNWFPDLAREAEIYNAHFFGGGCGDLSYSILRDYDPWADNTTSQVRRRSGAWYSGYAMTLISTRYGTVDLEIGQSYVDIVIDPPTGHHPSNVSLTISIDEEIDVEDSEPFDVISAVATNLSKDGFRAILNAPISREGYRLRWLILDRD